MNFYHCAQPTYEDLELMEGAEWREWDVEDLPMPEIPSPPEQEDDREWQKLQAEMNENVDDTPSTPAPGTPAPRQPSGGVIVPLFPNRREKEAAKKKKTTKKIVVKPPQPSTKRYLSLDAWRYGVLLFCDVSTLLRLNATCSQIRKVLNEPSFVVEWQTACWYLKERPCRCERNVFYLDVSLFLDFAWDALEVRSSRLSDVALKSTGRTLNMDIAHQVPLPHVDPRKSPRCFLPGLLDIWYENWIVPVPRMTFVSVEETQVFVPVGNRDPFWMEHHAVPEVDPKEEEETLAQQLSREIITPQHPLPTGFLQTGPDLVKAYTMECELVHRDPHDPAQDNEDCLGYHAVRWARRRLYETAVGVQTYPLQLCLRRSDLVGRAYRSGLQHLDLLFLPIQRSRTGHGDGDIQLLAHRGPIYFHPVRYNNEAGDFAVWALSTLALTQGLYVHAWFDSVHHVMQRMDDFVRTLALEVQEDMPMYRMCDRWNHLHRRIYLGEAAMPLQQDETQPTNTLERQQKRDQAALDLMYDTHYSPYNRLIGGMATRGDEVMNAGFWAPYTTHYGYLTDLLPDPTRHFANQRTEAMLVYELRELMRVMDYIVRFSLTVGPMTDPVTEMRRFRCLEAYLGAGTALLMFAPSFRRIGSWRPSDGNDHLTSQVPRINLQHNHRFRHYLRFLNERTLFYSTQR